jgi:secreted protein with Ig-like and vWFA domain
MVADNPIASGILGIFGDASMMGKTVTINGTVFLDHEGSMPSALDNRIMVRFQGGSVYEMTTKLQGMDFAAVAVFDRP